MRKTTIEVGERYGRLTVISPNRDERGWRVWDCVCDCGEKRSLLSGALYSGKTRSCGCLSREVSAKRFTIHGLSGNKRAMTCYKGIMGRCYNKNNADYASYGGRGIAVSEEWRNNFEQFFRDMGNPPPGKSIDRIDVNGDYSQKNCRWADHVQQASNKRNSRSITLDGETYSISSFSRKFNRAHSWTWTRLNRGWSAEDLRRGYQNEPEK